MGTQVTIMDPKSESHVHLATIERHDLHIKIVSIKAYIHVKLVQPSVFCEVIISDTHTVKCTPILG